jgi:hypothetical protein
MAFVGHQTSVQSASSVATSTTFYPTFVTQANLMDKKLSDRFEKQFSGMAAGTRNVKGKIIDSAQTPAPILPLSTPAFSLSVEPPSSESVVHSTLEPIQHWTLLGREVTKTATLDFDPEKEKRKSLVAMTQDSTRTATSQITFEFDVALQRNDASEEVGLRLGLEAGYYPVVKEVYSTGLIAAWNGQHAGSANVQIGDRILEVNGISATAGNFLDAIQRDLVLNLTVRRFVQHEASQKQKDV